MMVFPDAVVKTMKAGWMKHIHLDMLTAAFAEHELLKPSSSTSIIRTNADGTLEASEKSHPSDKERNMDFQEWCGAYIRHIHLIRLYYPGADRDEIADAFNLHFSTLRDDPTAPKMWEVFLDYDVRIRRTFVSHGILPKDFQPNFFRQAQQEWLINKINSIPATNSSSRYHPYDRSTFDRHPSSFRNDRPPPKTYNKGQYTDSFRAKPNTLKVFLPYTKIARNKGETIFLSEQYGPSNPISALQKQLQLRSGSPDTLLFSYDVRGLQQTLTKPEFMARCNTIWLAHGLPRSTGHSFRIGGTTHLLLCGIDPSIIKKAGRWTSDSFLRYWRNLEVILPAGVRFASSSTRPHTVGEPRKSHGCGRAQVG